MVRRLLFWMFKRVARLLWGTNISRLPLVDRASAYLRVHLRPGDAEFIELEGDRIYYNPKSILALHVVLFGTYEKLLREVFRRELKPGMTVLDLGAHIGIHTLLAAKLVGEQGKVFAFEPALHNYACLTRNITENGYVNVVAVNKAVSDGADKLRLYLPDYSVGPPNANAESVMAESTTLDEFFKNEDVRVDFVKMDVEGAEMAALRGMDSLMSRNKDLKLVTEFNPEFLRNAGYSPDGFLNKLTGHGFRLYDINEEKQSVELIGSSSLLEAYDAKRKRTNLLCIRTKWSEVTCSS